MKMEGYTDADNSNVVDFFPAFYERAFGAMKIIASSIKSGKTPQITPIQDDGVRPQDTLDYDIMRLMKILYDRGDIDGVRCVLDAYTDIASAAHGPELSPERAKTKAINDLDELCQQLDLCKSSAEEGEGGELLSIASFFRHAIADP